MAHLFAGVVDFAGGHPAAVAVVVIGIVLVAFVWAIVSSSYRYR